MEQDTRTLPAAWCSHSCSESSNGVVQSDATHTRSPFYVIEMHHSPLQKLSSFLICNSHHPAGEPMAAGRLLEPNSSTLPNFLNSVNIPTANCLPQRANSLTICVSPNSADHKGWMAHSLWTWLQEYVHQSQRSWCQRRQNSWIWTHFYQGVLTPCNSLPPHRPQFEKGWPRFFIFSFLHVPSVIFLSPQSS